MASRAKATYRAAYSDSLKVRAGDRVAVSDKQSEWPGWLWCTTENGKSGWIPATYIERQRGRATLLIDYDAVELTVEAGETVEILKEESGWAWCRKENGDLGWLPLDVLESPGAP